MLIQDYDPDWPIYFRKIQEALCLDENPHVVTIAHVGSTAVPKLAAKAIIDVDIIFGTEDDFSHLANRLNMLGYNHVGDQGIPMRQAFKRIKSKNHPVLDAIQHHLYACPVDSPEWHRHIIFRNYLRTHPTEADKYADLKREIALEAKQDRKVYAKLKERRARSFIEQCLELARVHPEKLNITQ